MSGYNRVGSIGMGQEESPLSIMSPEDYLEKTNMKTLIGDAVNLMLENRPENPILFLLDQSAS